MMVNKRKVAFWSAYLSFCVVLTFMIGSQGAFDGIDFGGTLIVLAMYLVSGFLIHLYVKKNPDQVEKWFR